MADRRPTQRKRITALVSPHQYEKLEELARNRDQPVSRVVTWIISTFLGGAQDLDRSANNPVSPREYQESWADCGPSDSGDR